MNESPMAPLTSYKILYNSRIVTTNAHAWDEALIDKVDLQFQPC